MKPKIILTPYFLDQFLPGLEELAQPEWIINRQPLPEGNQQTRISILHAALAGEVEEAVREELLPVSLAGDCCTAVGVLAGLRRAGIDPLLIWFDAHGDFNTWETTPSGFLGGMPLAMLAGLGDQSLLESIDIKPLPQERIILTDGRDLDPGEEQLVTASSIRHISDPLELLHFPLSDQAIWVHFDTDIVNPKESPAQNYPAAGGPGVEEMKQIFRRLAGTGFIQVVSLSSWNPGLESAEQSKTISIQLLDILLGLEGDQ
jgi:arginase